MATAAHDSFSLLEHLVEFFELSFVQRPSECEALDRSQSLALRTYRLTMSAVFAWLVKL
jgi:hypothetical protein